MKKLRPKASPTATGVNQRVTIAGGKKALSKLDAARELQGLLQVLASLVEENRGPLTINKDTVLKVIKEGRVLQIVDGQLSLSIGFEQPKVEETENAIDSTRDERFFESDTARETREWLRQRRRDDDTDSGRPVSGVSEAEQSVGRSE